MNDRTKELSNNDEIRLKDIVDTLGRHKFWGAGLVICCTVAVGIASYFVPKQYEAATTIEATTDTDNGSQGGALSSIGGNLAALAGLSGGADQKKTESIAVLQSASLSGRYIEQNNLMQILYAGKWDAARSQWKVSDPKQMPTLWKTNEFFRKSVRAVTTDSKTGLVMLTITWTDPVTAATWANGLVKLTNDSQRDSAIAESERNIAYLSTEAAKTDVLGIKQTIYSLLEREYGKAMLAKGNNEYAFKVIDKAVAPERPSYPNKLVWVLSAMFTSFSLYVLIAFCIVVWSKT